MTKSMDPEEEDFLDDTPEEEPVDSEDPLSVEQEHTGPADDTFHFKKELWGRNKWSFLLIIIVAAAIVIYTLPSMFKDRHDTEIPAIVTDKAGYINVDEEIIPESVIADIPSDVPVVHELPQDMEPQIPRETVSVEVPTKDVTEPPLPVHTEAVASKEYYIQVGAWRNSGYAESMLAKLKQYYPDIYVVKENNLNKIRIPGIRNRQEGSKIINDIRKKFNMNSLLVLKKE